MKILQLVTGLELGGAQKSTFNLAKELIAKGHHVAVASSGGCLIDDFKSLLKSNFKQIRFLRRSINPLCDAIAFFSLLIFVWQERFTIIHTHTSKAGILGRWVAFFVPGVKSVHTVHGFAFHDYQNFLVKFCYVLTEKIAVFASDQMIFVSEQVLKKALKYNIARWRKYQVIYELVKIEEVRFKDLSKDHFTVGMVAPLKEQKNPADFITSAYYISRQIGNVEFILVGDGKLKLKLLDMACRYGIADKIKFLGWRKDAYEIMSGFDLFMLTSIFEGQPHVIIEAMSLGLAIIATDVDGSRDLIINGQTGFLSPPLNPKSLAATAIKLLTDKDLRFLIGSNARRYYETEKRLDYMANLDKIEQLYLKLNNNE